MQDNFCLLLVLLMQFLMGRTGFLSFFFFFLIIYYLKTTTAAVRYLVWKIAQASTQRWEKKACLQSRYFIIDFPFTPHRWRNSPKTSQNIFYRRAARSIRRNFWKREIPWYPDQRGSRTWAEHWGGQNSGNLANTFLKSIAKTFLFLLTQGRFAKMKLLFRRLGTFRSEATVGFETPSSQLDRTNSLTVGDNFGTNHFLTLS